MVLHTNANHLGRLCRKLPRHLRAHLGSLAERKGGWTNGKCDALEKSAAYTPQFGQAFAHVLAQAFVDGVDPHFVCKFSFGAGTGDDCKSSRQLSLHESFQASAAASPSLAQESRELAFQALSTCQSLGERLDANPDDSVALACLGRAVTLSESLARASRVELHKQDLLNRMRSSKSLWSELHFNAVSDIAECVALYHGKVPAEELVMNMMAIADSKAGLSTADGSGGAVDAELAERQQQCFMQFLDGVPSDIPSAFLLTTEEVPRVRFRHVHGNQSLDEYNVPGVSQGSNMCDIAALLGCAYYLKNPGKITEMMRSDDWMLFLLGAGSKLKHQWDQLPKPIEDPGGYVRPEEVRMELDREDSALGSDWDVLREMFQRATLEIIAYDMVLMETLSVVEADAETFTVPGLCYIIGCAGKHSGLYMAKNGCVHCDTHARRFMGDFAHFGYGTSLMVQAQSPSSLGPIMARGSRYLENGTLIDFPPDGAYKLSHHAEAWRIKSNLPMEWPLLVWPPMRKSDPGVFLASEPAPSEPPTPRMCLSANSEPCEVPAEGPAGDACGVPRMCLSANSEPCQVPAEGAADTAVVAADTAVVEAVSLPTVLQADKREPAYTPSDVVADFLALKPPVCENGNEDNEDNLLRRMAILLPRMKGFSLAVHKQMGILSNAQLTDDPINMNWAKEMFHHLGRANQAAGLLKMVIPRTALWMGFCEKAAAYGQKAVGGDAPVTKAVDFFRPSCVKKADGTTRDYQVLAYKLQPKQKGFHFGICGSVFRGALCKQKVMKD